MAECVHVRRKGNRDTQRRVVAQGAKVSGSFHAHHALEVVILTGGDIDSVEAGQSPMPLARKLALMQVRKVRKVINKKFRSSTNIATEVSSVTVKTVEN